MWPRSLVSEIHIVHFCIIVIVSSSFTAKNDAS